MSSIALENVNVNYPVVEDHYRSFRRAALRFMTGGRMYQEDRGRVIHALKDITLSISDGDRLALVGRNGAGKSTFLKTVGGFILPDSGDLTIKGRVTSLFSVNGGMDLERTGYDNIYLTGRLLGIHKIDMQKNVADIEEFSELGKFLDMPVRSYSDGMKVRLGIAIVTCVNPDILVLDEAIGATDAHFMEKTTRRAQKLYDRASIIVMASHDTALLSNLCNKALWLDQGRIKQAGPIEDVIKAYTSST